MPRDPKYALREYYAGKTKTRKDRLSHALQDYAAKLGYSFIWEEGAFGSKNLVLGDPGEARFLLTCGSACSGVEAWLELARIFPENRRQRVCFVLFDGKAGESAFGRNHKSDRQLRIHLDHVGDGTHLRIYPTSKLKQDRVRLTSLYRACGYFGARDLLVEENKIPLALRINSRYPHTVTIRALQNHKKGMRFIGKTKDTVFDETNVNILRAALTTYICCDEVN